MRKKKISASVVGLALIFTLIFTWGLCTAADYGVYFDEPSEQEILRQNLKEYAVRLGDGQAVAYYDRLGVQCISESVEKRCLRYTRYRTPVRILLSASYRSGACSFPARRDR